MSADAWQYEAVHEERRRNPTPGQQVIAHLARAKANGQPFDLAWRRAVERIKWGRTVRQDDKLAWRNILAAEEIRAELRACYLDLPTPVGAALRRWENYDAEPDDEPGEEGPVPAVLIA